jgi:AraC family transcriptional regulator, alkane utilization regulator
MSRRLIARSHRPAQEHEFDLLSDVLRTLAFRHFCITEFLLGTPWGLRQSANHRAGCSLTVIQGRCMYRTQAGQGWLETGDTLVAPRGGAIDLASAPRVRLTPMSSLWGHSDYPGLQAFPMAASFRKRLGGPVTSCRLLGVVFEINSGQDVELLDSLPSSFVVPTKAGSDASPRGRLLEYLTEVGDEYAVGDFAPRSRVAEALIISLIREHMLSATYTSGRLAGLKHPQVGRALCIMHRRHAEAWTVAALAAEVGMSRAAFAERFREVVGKPPLEYLNDWRIRSAFDLLLTTRRSIDEISYLVGYESERAFRRNFSRVVGMTPRDYRRQTPSNSTLASGAGRS